MAQISDLQQEATTQLASWEIFRPLVEDTALHAIPCIKNQPGEVHRVDLTGYDRQDVPCVRGRLYLVVHGVLSSSNTGEDKNIPDADDDDDEEEEIPATLIVFEWEFFPQHPSGGHRFQRVDIKVTFESTADSRPGETPSNAAALRAHYAPRVISMAPREPIESLVTNREVTPCAVSAEIALGFSPFVTFKASVANSAEGNKMTVTDYRLIAGVPVYSRHDSGKADAVTWLLHENEPQKSGVQSPVRTAVLLARQAGDYGKFAAVIETKATLSSRRQAAAEKVRKWIGLIPVDDAVCFDPSEVRHGAVVVEGRRDWVKRRPCPCDASNLEKEDLGRFLIRDWPNMSAKVSGLGG